MTPTKEQLQAARDDIQAIFTADCSAEAKKIRIARKIYKHLNTILAALTPPEPADSEVADAIIYWSSQKIDSELAREMLSKLISHITRLEAEKKAAVEALEKIVAGNYSAQTNQIAYHTLAKLGVPKK